MKCHLFLSSLLLFGSSIQLYAEVQEVERKDPRWKQKKQLTIKTDNQTKRIFEVHKQDSDSFFYIASKENTEKFWTEYKFQPKGNDETKNRVEPMLEWGTIDEGNRQATNKKDTIDKNS